MHDRFLAPFSGKRFSRERAWVSIKDYGRPITSRPLKKIFMRPKYGPQRRSDQVVDPFLADELQLHLLEEDFQSCPDKLKGAYE